MALSQSMPELEEEQSIYAKEKQGCRNVGFCQDEVNIPIGYRLI